MVFKSLVPSLVFASTACSLEITLDFTHDDFFTNPSNPYGATAQAALQAAADEISNVISTSLSPVDSQQVTNYSGGSVAQLTNTYRFYDPQNSDTLLSTTTLLGQDEMIIYVGTQSMDIFTFAEASPGTASLSLGGGGSSSDWPSAMAGAEALGNDLWGRGGPQIFDLTGSASLGGVSANFDINYSAAVGSMWFNDSPGDSSSGQESYEENANYWHFDHTTPVENGKIDLYSVAMHEILHILGYGTGDNWLENVDGSQWTGQEVENILGAGAEALDPDQYHLLEGLMSEGYLDGVERTTVMNASPQAGSRDQLTLLDFAFLEDMGYEINASAIPEPATTGFLVLTLTFTLRRTRS